MTPLLPAMLGTGMIKVLLTLLTTFKVMDATGATYTFFYSMADSFFYFLPVFLGWSIAKKMNASVPLFMVIGAALCYPDLVAIMGGASALPAGTFLGMPCNYMFGVIPVIETSYTSSVLPMLLMAPIMKWAENFADRVSPNVLKAFLKPMLFCLICLPVVLIVLGPLGGVVGNALSGVFSAMYNAVPWLTVGILSAIMPFIVMTGMHYALIPLCMNNMATLGYDVIVLVTMFCSNVAQGGASLGVAVKTKDTELKSEGIACGISAVVAGVTEPAMYGINLRFMKPMIGAVVGAGLSGLWCGITGVKGYTMGGSPSALSLIQFVDSTPGAADPFRGVIFGAIGLVISLVVSFILAMFLYKDEAVESAADVNQAAINAGQAAMAGEEVKKALAGKVEIAAPMAGEVVKLADVPDEVFASGALGEGIAIVPSDGKVYAPCDATVTTLMDSKHAVGLLSDDGPEILIHVGLDTVGLNGGPFTYHIKQGQQVKKGDLLLTADLDAIKKAGLKTHTPVIITNTEDYAAVTPAKLQNVRPGDKIITVS